MRASLDSLTAMDTNLRPGTNLDSLMSEIGDSSRVSGFSV